MPAMLRDEMKNRLNIIWSSSLCRWKTWLGITLGFTLLYYLALMAALILKFGNFPNYAVAYNWPKNVWKIIQSTPSYSDMLPIIADEWLLEFGYMNYDFGKGISEWGLNIIPTKVLVVLILAALLATNYALLVSKRQCKLENKVQSSATAGLGAMFVALTSATMSWVVCCATPSWIVGLSMMGMGVSLSLWLEPIGPFVTALGFGLLFFSLYVLSAPAQPTRKVKPVENKEKKNYYNPLPSEGVN